MPQGVARPPFQSFPEILLLGRQPRTFASDCLTQSPSCAWGPPASSLPPELPALPRGLWPSSSHPAHRVRDLAPFSVRKLVSFPHWSWAARKGHVKLEVGPPWPGFPLLPLTQPASWLPFSEHLLCAWHFTHMIYDSLMTTGETGILTPTLAGRKLKRTCPWSAGK